MSSLLDLSMFVIHLTMTCSHLPMFCIQLRTIFLDVQMLCRHLIILYRHFQMLCRHLQVFYKNLPIPSKDLQIFCLYIFVSRYWFMVFNECRMNVISDYWLIRSSDVSYKVFLNCAISLSILLDKFSGRSLLNSKYRVGFWNFYSSVHPLGLIQIV